MCSLLTLVLIVTVFLGSTIDFVFITKNRSISTAIKRDEGNYRQDVAPKIQVTIKI